MVREKALEHDIRLHADVVDLPEIIRADERKLKQILYNLLYNAMKFTPDGGEVRASARLITSGDLSVQARNGRKGTELERGGHVPEHRTGYQPVTAEARGAASDTASKLQGNGVFIDICVSDTGIGLRLEDVERIFNPFEQVDGSTSRRYQGTGLGLALARRLVELHGGMIWAESDGEGRGSAFHFTIPLVEV